MLYPHHRSSHNPLLHPDLNPPHYNFEPDDFDPYAGQNSRTVNYAYDGPCKLDKGHRSDTLRRALALDLPPCSVGTFPVRAEELILYFGKEDNTIGYIPCRSEDPSRTHATFVIGV